MDELDSISSDQEAIEQAPSAVYSWRGKPLARFSFRRNACFERLSVFGRGVTSNLEAAATIVYLCTLDDKAGIERMDRARDRESIAALRDDMAKWADDEGLTMNNAEGIECSRIADAIFTDIQRSKFEPVIDGQKKSTVPSSIPATKPIISRPSSRSRKAA